LEREAKHPALVLLTAHWLSMFGAALVTSAAFSWLILVLGPGRRGSDNTYLGILTFFVLPAIFVLGLLLIPVGVWLAKRRVRSAIESLPMDRSAAFRRLAIFLAVTTLANLLLVSQFTYRAVERMETADFCGQSCHVMQPHFRAHRAATHSGIGCVECHVAPGASGWIAAKTSGTRQLFEVVTGSYPRPVPSAIETNRLVSSRETCERCHSRLREAPPRVRTIRNYADDERNTPSYTVMIPKVGGNSGIHRAHLDPDVEIRYASLDPKRESIPWVEWRNRRTGEVRQYRAAAAKGDPTGTRFEMQCVDCHNRPAHTFERPERAVDQAIASGAIDVSLPSVRKNAVAWLKASYTSEEAAADAIRKNFGSHYPNRPEEVRRAAEAVSAIYARNVFPDQRVTWGTYANNLGHTDSPGCFRCHDGDHAASDGKSITQDCASCHEMLAVDEANPEVLKKLNLLTAFEGEIK
jgi:nitrate/TMAO reductase-like tetraheme cytochrome c subunit